MISNERSLTLAAAGNDQAVFTGAFASSCHGGYAAAAGTLKFSGGDIGGGSENLATFWNGNQYAESLTCTSDRQLMPDKARLQCVITPSGGEVSDTLDASYYKGVGSRDGKERTVVLLNDQGGSAMQVERDGNAGTLRANTHGNEQIVCVHGAETPIFNTQEYANPVTANHGGLENVISCNSKKQGMDISNELCGTLNATDYKEPQVVCYENHANDSRVKNMGECCQTLEARAGMGGGNLPLVQECYSVDRRNQTVDAELSGTLTNCGGGDNYNTVMESIAFEPGIAKREGGHSRFTEGVSSTLRCDMGDNQTAVAIAENIIGRQVQNGGNGTGAQEELAYTQNASGVMGVAVNNNEGEDYGDATKTRSLQVLLDLRNKIGEKAFQQWAFGRLIGFQKEEILQQELYEQNLQGKTEEKQSELDDSPLSRTELDAENALLCLWKSAEPGYPPYRQELAQQFIGQLDLLMQKLSCQNTSRKHATVRRLLPIETERLMGFPDNHTRISWKGKPAEECPDSPRYKACGNSMCVNVMRWIGMRIELVERRLGR